MLLFKEVLGSCFSGSKQLQSTSGDHLETTVQLPSLRLCSLFFIMIRREKPGVAVG